MTDWHCKIGKVTPKRNLVLLDTKPRSLSDADLHDMRQNLETIINSMDRGIAGLVIIGWDFDGYFNRATRHHPESPWGPTILPAFVAEILCKDVMRDTARGVLDEI